MSMEITWLDFQLSTDNQNGRHLALSVFKRNRKRGYSGHSGFINFNKSFLFSVKCLKPGIYSFLGSASVLPLSAFKCNPNRGYSSHLDFIIHLRFSACITYWKQLSDLLTIWVTASAEGYLSASTAIFIWFPHVAMLNQWGGGVVPASPDAWATVRMREDTFFSSWICFWHNFRHHFPLPHY